MSSGPETKPPRRKHVTDFSAVPTGETYLGDSNLTEHKSNVCHVRGKCEGLLAKGNKRKALSSKIGLVINTQVHRRDPTSVSKTNTCDSGLLNTDKATNAKTNVTQNVASQPAKVIDTSSKVSQSKGEAPDKSIECETDTHAKLNEFSGVVDTQ